MSLLDRLVILFVFTSGSLHGSVSGYRAHWHTNHFVIENNGDLAILERRVEQCWTWMMEQPRPEPGGPVVPIRSRGAN